MDPQLRTEALTAAAAAIGDEGPTFDEQPAGHYLTAPVEELDAALGKAGLYRTARSL